VKRSRPSSQRKVGITATPKLDEDGDFGPKTRAMVRRFQSENGLPPTGLADRATIGEIERHLRDIEEA
jgi:peptidoglycan hydrolase-like protein with peptidoglycan-binding domain